jgi:hypothetical protein
MYVCMLDTKVNVGSLRMAGASTSDNELQQELDAIGRAALNNALAETYG